jgi:ribosomal protein S4
MRPVNKYKGYDKLKQIFKRFPLRIKKFKSTKWKKVQKVLASKLKKDFRKSNKKTFSRSKIFSNKKTFSRRKIFQKKRSFKENLFVKARYKTWDKVRNYYKEGGKIKTAILYLFGRDISLLYLRNILKHSKSFSETLDVYTYVLLKPEFRLDILLCRLNFFSSSYQAFQIISEKKIMVNDKTVSGNFSLSKGDIISFKSNYNLKTLNLRKIRSNLSFSDSINSFIEVDYYSNRIIVVKDLKSLSQDDFFISVEEHHNLKKLKDYI